MRIVRLITVKRNNRIVYAALFLGALSARLLKMMLDPMLLRDSAFYLSLAERWTAEGYSQTVIDGTVIIPPFPIYCITKLMACNFSAEIAGRSISMFLGSIIPLLGYIIAYKIFKKNIIAVITAVLLIIHPSLVSYSTQPLRESYYLFFMGLLIIEIVNGIKEGKIKYWGLCGFFLSFALFCRYESIEFILFCPLIILYLFLRRNIDQKKFIKDLSSFFLALLVTSGLLLSITSYNLLFISNIAKYLNRPIQLYYARDSIQNDSQSYK